MLGCDCLKFRTIKKILLALLSKYAISHYKEMFCEGRSQAVIISFKK